MLSSLGRRLDFKVEQRIVEPQWLHIRKHFSAEVDPFSPAGLSPLV